ncbi:EF-P beta-lysylation protein EpmB [Marinobacter halophilus]|uniref:L-lysine 2,3-aminomutase n=1 Tax=Marinobacter halophilus TaxID=1323740 RepID=A0A2T1KCY1_9GAMM|nr:EF-P beta-lysylation protein EpmB [Marinobacter halophilus]PSF07910.1 EF-P beta-lysylation protein EpmB [Marinobacter halophilus]GGC58169.1 EF-P beta-lysylation protein EpmB [Marinobacter halophilus]
MIQRTPARIEARNEEPSVNGVNQRDQAGTQVQTWQQILANSVTDPEQLLARLGLPLETWLSGANAGHRLFPVRVPEPFIRRMQLGNVNDPLLRQVLPLVDEALFQEGYVHDPLAESAAIQTTGLIRKYQSRALLMVTGQCAINCRYCFRRHFPYDSQRLGPDDRQQVLASLQASPDINEVIFSGGDPLAVNDRLLAQWARALAGVPHIKRLRIHSRLPVVIPQRVCDDLLGWLKESPLQKVLVVHVNHPAELDNETNRAFSRLRDAGVTLLNQSVILKGVNDSADTLAKLSEDLFASGVLPYYLHAFDPVAGAHHFDVNDQTAAALVQDLMKRLPGFLVPKLVRELPGEASKTPVAPDNLPARFTSE